MDDLGGRRCVVQLDDAQILRSEAGRFVGFGDGGFKNIRLVLAGCEIPSGSKCARTHAHRLGESELTRLALAHQHHRRRAIADRRAHRQRQWPGHFARGQHLFDAHHVAELRARIHAAVKGILRRHGGDLLARGAVLLHVRDRHRRVDVHEHRTVGARAVHVGRQARGTQLLIDRDLELIHALDIGSTGEDREGLRLILMHELFVAAGQHHVVRAERDHGRRLMKGGGAGRAGVLDIDDRAAPDTDLAQDDLARNADLPGDHCGGRIAHPGRLNLVGADARIGQRLQNRFARQGLEIPVGVFAEAGHADARDDRALFHGHPRIRFRTDPDRSSPCPP